jgi:hypothetical protein
VFLQSGADYTYCRNQLFTLNFGSEQNISVAHKFGGSFGYPLESLDKPAFLCRWAADLEDVFPNAWLHAIARIGG